MKILKILNLTILKFNIVKSHLYKFKDNKVTITIKFTYLSILDINNTKDNLQLITII